jgi:hypothetical protein
MSVTTFDTLIDAKKLKGAGFTEQQAEIQAETLKNVIDNNLAAKQDIDKVNDKIDKLELTLTIKFGMMLVAAIGILAAVIKL